MPGVTGGHIPGAMMNFSLKTKQAGAKPATNRAPASAPKPVVKKGALPNNPRRYGSHWSSQRPLRKPK